MPKQSLLKKSQGFTLIELLIVILVIGSLSGVLLAVINSSGIRGKARDSQRQADIKKIQTALELYFADNRMYPISDGGAGAGSWEQVNPSATNQIISTLQPDYMDPVPTDPKEETGGNTDPCGTETFHRYNYISDGSYYWITAIMEVATSNDSSECADNVGCGASYATADYCYFAQNP